MLNEFFRINPRAAIAFSGGVDSSYLFYAAVKSGADVCAYYVKTEFQPEFELEDAIKLAAQIGGELKILRASILEHPEVTENNPLRCYNCKKQIIGIIAKAAAADNYTRILDGNNASDDTSDRPGMRAASELGVRSPLREAGLTKRHIRELSREAGLFTWDKPAYSCLATRIPSGTRLTKELLNKAERSEGILFQLGFTDFRVRLRNGSDGSAIEHGSALLQFSAPQLERARKMWDTIKNKLSGEFTSIELDPKPRQ